MDLQSVGKYEIVTTLGRGSMGVVYKARDPEIGRLVAIKTLRSIFLGDDPAGNEALQRFRQESRSAGRLQHRNIVTIYEAGRTENGSPYIVMEHIEGESLEKLISEKAPIDPREALHYLAQVASAIDYAHSQGVIHRDIKPSNILVDNEYVPHLLDFGVAKLSDTSLTPAGTVVGTPSYMSPEQIRGEKLDGGTDRFAFAVVAFETLTGVRPFPGKDFTTVVGNIIHKEPRCFSEIGIGLPAELEQILIKGLSKDRTGRYASALEFVDEIAGVFGIVIDGAGVAGGVKEPTPPPVASVTKTQEVHVVSQASAIANEQRIADTSGRSANETNVIAPLSELVKENARMEVEVKTNGFDHAAEKVKIPLAATNGDGQAALAKSEPSPRSIDHTNSTIQISANEVAWLVRFLAAVALILLALSIYLYSSDNPSGIATAPVAEQRTVALPEVLTEEDVGRLDNAQLLLIFSSPKAGREVIVWALKEAFSRRNETLIKQAAFQVASGPDYRLRIELLKQLNSSNYRETPIGFSILQSALSDKEFLVRGFAAKILGEASGSEVRQLLQHQLEREQNDVVRKVIEQSLTQLN